MAKIAIVFHSGYGHTRRLAEAVAAGAGAEAQLLPIDAEGNLPESAWETLNAAKAIIFGSPTYMGAASWQFKKFADATSKAWFTQQWKDKLFAGFTNSASMIGDKSSTLQSMMGLAMQHGGLWVGLGLLPSNAKSAQRNDLNFLGSYIGAAAQSPADASPDEMFAGDLETGKVLGQRVANMVAKIAL